TPACKRPSDLSSSLSLSLPRFDHSARDPVFRGKVSNSNSMNSSLRSLCSLWSIEFLSHETQRHREVECLCGSVVGTGPPRNGDATMTSPEPRFAKIAAMIGDPTRARMLSALMGGQYLAAGELAAAAGVTAQTASAHVAKLVEADLVVARAQGRHRYFRL